MLVRPRLYLGDFILDKRTKETKALVIENMHLMYLCVILDKRTKET